MSKYNCQYCNHEFRQKVDLDRHLKKKNGCIPISKFPEIVNSSSLSGKTNEVRSVFKSCLDHLRNDAGHLIGDDAFMELSRFIILKQSENHMINGLIDIYNMKKYNQISIQEYTEDQFKKNIEYVKFSNFIEYVKNPEKEENIKNVYDNFLWDQVLSKLDQFKDVFPEGKNSSIKESKTIKKIVITLSSIDFDKYDFDILGEAYESIFVDAVFGAGGNKKSELGQFFTPPKVKKLLLSLTNPSLKYDENKNPEIESVLEPASGTGGILNSVIKHYNKYVKSDEITSVQLREQLIKNIHGIELKDKIFNLCLSNMLINTGTILPNVICADSIRKYHNKKVDVAIANPPFSVNIPYEDLPRSLGGWDILNDYIPVEATGANSEMLFLQMMIHCLNINGRCATVMLDGNKMFGTSSGYNKVREYLMKSCELHEVIMCPSGTFTSTGAKTCILFFTKRKDRKDVLQITGEDKKRRLKFAEGHCTKTVKFYEFNPDTEQKYHLLDVDISNISKNNYSLSYSEYIKKEENVKYNYDNYDNIEIKTLGDVCEFKNGKGIKKDELVEGDYPVIGGGQKPMGYHNQYNNEENTILCSSSGAYSGYISKYNTKIWASDCFSIKPKDNLSNLYLFYYLKFHQENIYKLQNGAAQPHVYSKDISNIEIPIPSLEHQKEIVEFLDKLFENSKLKLGDISKYYENNEDNGDNMFSLLLKSDYKTFEEMIKWQEQSILIQEQIDFLKERNKRYIYLSSKGSNDHKKLGDVCEVNQGNSLTKTEMIDGIYDVIGGGKIIGKHNQKNRDGNDFTLTRVGDININYIDKPYYLTDNGFSLKSKQEDNTTKYVYYLLSHNKDYLTDLYKGTAQKVISKTNLKSIKIPIPSIERQKEIVEYCEKNDTVISSLEKEIEMNKELASQFLKDILKSNVLEKYDVFDASEHSNHEENDKKDESTSTSPKKIIHDSPRSSTASSTIEDKKQLTKKTILELKEQIKKMGIKKSVSKLKKEELIDTIINGN
jgi:type I restriction enzyme S subunit